MIDISVHRVVEVRARHKSDDGTSWVIITAIDATGNEVDFTLFTNAHDGKHTEEEARTLARAVADAINAINSEVSPCFAL